MNIHDLGIDQVQLHSRCSSEELALRHTVTTDSQTALAKCIISRRNDSRFGYGTQTLGLVIKAHRVGALEEEGRSP